MKVLVIQNCKTEGIGLYEEYLKEKNIAYSVFHAYTGKRFPPNNNFDAFIIGGTPIPAYEAHKHRFLRNELMYLRGIIELDKPCFGICCGGQLLALLLRAKVKKNPVMEIGGYYVKLTQAGKKSKLFKNFPTRFPVFHWHGDTFDIPKGARLLVQGIDCKNQAFSYKKTIALIFHLEITSEQAKKWADVYKDELKRVNKTKTQVINECKIREKKMKRLAILLLDDFFAMLR